MQTFRKAAIAVAALASVAAISAAPAAYAQSNRYTRVQAGTSGYLGPNGFEHRGYPRGYGAGFPGIFGGGAPLPSEEYGPVGGPGPFYNGY